MMPPRSAYVKHCSGGPRSASATARSLKRGPPLQYPSAIMRSFQFVDVPDAELGKLRAEAVKVQSQLARFEAFARLLFFRKPLGAEPSHFRSRFASHDNDTIRIGNNDVARANTCSGTNNRNIDRTRRGFYGSLSGDCLRPDGKLHLRKISHVTNTGIDHQPGNAVGASRFSE